MSGDVNELVARLEREAVAAIRREAGALAYDQHRIRGLTLDFSVSKGGKLVTARVYVERDAIRPERM